MKFLTIPVNFYFDRPIRVSRTKYSYWIHRIHPVDFTKISMMLENIDPELEISLNGAYVKGGVVLFNDPSDPSGLGTYKENRWWLPKIKVLGVKTNERGQKSPIWRLEVAELIL